MAAIRQVSGWKPWFYPKITRNGYRTASAPFPPTYLPAKAFWAETFATHCLLPTPWKYFEDPLSAFYLEGGTTSLTGALFGLAGFDRVLTDTQTGAWGIGQSMLGIPTVGFCIGLVTM